MLELWARWYWKNWNLRIVLMCNMERKMGGGGGGRHFVMCCFRFWIELNKNQKEKYDVVMDLLFLSSYFVLVAHVIIMIWPVKYFFLWVSYWSIIIVFTSENLKDVSFMDTGYMHVCFHVKYKVNSLREWDNRCSVRFMMYYSHTHAIFS